MEKERRRLTLDQGEASSFDKQSLKEVSKRISKNSILFNSEFRHVMPPVLYLPLTFTELSGLEIRD